MEDIQYSALLKQILNHGKSIPTEKSGVLTPRLFLLAVMDAVSGKIGTEEKDEAEHLREAWTALLQKCDLHTDDLYENLKANIEEDKTQLTLASIHMQQKFVKAKEKAGKEGKTILDAADFLNVFAGEDGAELPAYLSVKKPAAQQETAPTGEAHREPAPAAAPAPEPEPADASPEEQKRQIAALTETVKKMHKALSERVLGQENAVNVFVTGYFQSELAYILRKKKKGPRATFLFAGPPGVGKTLLAETIADVISQEGKKIPFQQFNMSEYCDKEASLEFIGSDDVYKGSKQGNFTSFVQKNPHSVILFDEIEKAHISIIHLFLQILDKGEIRDSKTDELISVRDTIMIFTTNAGKQLYEDADSDDYSLLSRKVILKALERDVNPVNGQPFFPAAICSRFASGNVVMFNHLNASTLRMLAEKEIRKQAEEITAQTGIDLTFDDRVFTAVLFSEGGLVDGRTITARATAFINEELYELFRLIESERVGTGIQDLAQIDVEVELSDDTEIQELFHNDDKAECILFANDNVAAYCREHTDACTFFVSQNTEEALGFMEQQDISFVLLDPETGRVDEGYLNIEDEESDARDFFWMMKERYPGVPVYVLQRTCKMINEEERESFMKVGVQDVLTVDGEEPCLQEHLQQIIRKIFQNDGVMRLAKANKVATFETAQVLSQDGRTAIIKLFDFELETAVDAEDSDNVLSNVSKPNTTFDEVIGAEDAKEELKYFCRYLQNPKKFAKTGVNAPHGVILYGPPGTGKTMLAKAMAHESDVTFIAAEGNKFLQKYVGEGVEKVHQLFTTARKYAPSILFIDEIDVIAKERGSYGDGYNADDVLTAFLTEMDGFHADPSRPVFVLAATNFDVKPGSAKSLDAALMRRFDRKIFVDLPNRDERLRFLHQEAEKNAIFQMDDDLLKNLAMRSTGMSLADLSSIMELALRSAVCKGNMQVSNEALEDAFESFNSGETKKWSNDELLNTARHEAGHAFLAWQSGKNPSYVTIVSRGNYGGYVRTGDDEDKMTLSKRELLDRIRMSLGGRGAEIAYYGEEAGLTTGASSDLEHATHLAQHMICSLGMVKDFGLAVIDEKQQTDELALQIRLAVNEILQEEMTKGIELIRNNREGIDALVEQLMLKNHLTGEEVDRILTDACAPGTKMTR